MTDPSIAMAHWRSCGAAPRTFFNPFAQNYSTRVIPRHRKNSRKKWGLRASWENKGIAAVGHIVGPTLDDLLATANNGSRAIAISNSRLPHNKSHRRAKT